MICPNMKATTLEKVHDSLLDLTTEITVDPGIVIAARRAVERMVAVG
jgi:quinolinate synthase